MKLKNTNHGSIILKPVYYVGHRQEIIMISPCTCVYFPLCRLRGTLLVTPKTRSTTEDKFQFN